MPQQAPALLPSGHVAPQLIGLAAGVAGADDRDLHHLLLEERHAERPLEDRLEDGMRRPGGFFAVSALQIRVHHAALDRAGPHDRDLDHQVVEGLGAQARQHRHLRAALDLKDAHRVGAADHRVDRRAPPAECASWPRSDRTRRVMGSAPSGTGKAPSAWIMASALRMAVSMPRPSTSTLKKPSVSMSSLSHGTTVRFGMRAGSTGRDARRAARPRARSRRRESTGGAESRPIAARARSPGDSRLPSTSRPKPRACFSLCSASSQ